MRGQAIFYALVLILAPAATKAAIIVNAARPITHRVTVQLIQTALDNGTFPATVFGNATQRADVEAGIDTIWAQAGIDVAFLPDLVRYDDTFAYQGSSGSNTRPTGDLSTIRNNAQREGGILNADSFVLNMFMVDVVPGFKPLGENYAAGLARIAANGIAAFVGDSLLTYDNGRDVVASVIAHEIGHNLGLDHAATGGDNLMSPQGSSERLTQSQINTVFSATNFAKLLPVVLVGDYNADGIVDAADYPVWRNQFGKTGSSLAADGNGDGSVDANDYAIWKTNFGKSEGAASGAVDAAAVVPEPAAWITVAAALATIMLRRRSKHHERSTHE
jgi:Dockerin type I domain/Metallo-peptidase family M12B Reprolysin-like